jgi:ATP-dependent phosphofructokinase / diphosphate-dependent phosphofructokinase
MSIKRIAISTGGGDAPGLNAVIRGVVLSAKKLGWDVIGIKRGYEGLLDIRQTVELTEEIVRDITTLGGTIIGTTNRGNPFEYPVKQPDGTYQVVNRSSEVLENFKKLKLDCLIAVGGDGSLKIAEKLYELGMPIVGVPKTIDNDLASTVITFGFDTAVSSATEALDKLHSTAESHQRVMVVEVMGRYAGWIALNSGVSSAANIILIPEIPYDIEKVCQKIMEREARGLEYSIVVVAEGARPIGGHMIFAAAKEAGREIRLGGISSILMQDIEQRTGKETRSLVLGHLQRGGGPTTFDRLIALRFGAAAVRAIADGKIGYMVALNPPTVSFVPIAEAVAHMKTVPLDCDTIITARSLGICLGD